MNEAESAGPEHFPMFGPDLTENDELALRLSVDFASSLLSHFGDQAAATARWLLASLLALNGGAIIAGLSSDKMEGPTLATASAVWLLGIFLALAGGFFSMKGAASMIVAATKMYAGSVAGLQAGKMPRMDFEGEYARVGRLSKIGFWVQGLSALAFFTGALAASKAFF
jgi:hypothetical protein